MGAGGEAPRKNTSGFGFTLTRSGLKAENQNHSFFPKGAAAPGPRFKTNRDSSQQIDNTVKIWTPARWLGQPQNFYGGWGDRRGRPLRRLFCCVLGENWCLPLDVKLTTICRVVMIRGFKDKDTDTEALFQAGKSRRFAAIQMIALRKLDMLDAARQLKDLGAPPGNRLEALSGDRAGRFSIRINQQWRICFVWTDSGADEVEIADYHEEPPCASERIRGKCSGKNS